MVAGEVVDWQGMPLTVVAPGRWLMNQSIIGREWRCEVELQFGGRWSDTGRIEWWMEIRRG